jgi:hypothetical protein
MNDPQQADANIQVATLTQPNQPLGFELSGTGTLAPEGSAGASAAGGGSSSMGQGPEQRSGPGGGLGPPIDAPDPLQRYRWPIIGGFVLVLAGGAFYMTKRQRAALAAGTAGNVEFDTPEPPQPVTPRVSRPAPSPPTRVATSAPVSAASAAVPAAAPVATATAPRPSMLLEALKEEIFQLELEHKQGKISQQEYEKAKAALDGTLERALKRDAQKN